MKELYHIVADRIRKGRPAVMLTSLPKGTGKQSKEILELEQSKEILDLDRDDRGIPEEVREAVKKGIPAMVETEDRVLFAELFAPKARLIVLGGGHIAVPLVKFAAETGFSVTVVDDRPSFANTARFPQAEQVICQAFEDSFDMLEVSEYDYVVVITRGHRHDTLCLRELLSREETYYLGMIGSKHRVSGVKQLMIEEGYDPERIGRICTPIGLKIGAVTPEEISISILAELISCKRLGNGRGRAASDRSELAPEILPAIFDPKDRSFAVVTVMAVKGSTPRGPGAKMLVYPDLRIVGSIGGGCSEGQIIRDAFSIIGTGRFLIKTIDLTGDVAESEGMVCGGIMKVLVEDFTEGE